MTNANKYLYRLSQGCDAAIMALQRIKAAPTKAFEEDINERISAIETIIANLQIAKRSLLFYKNRQRAIESTYLPPNPPTSGAV